MYVYGGWRIMRKLDWKTVSSHYQTGDGVLLSSRLFRHRPMALEEQVTQVAASFTSTLHSSRAIARVSWVVEWPLDNGLSPSSSLSSGRALLLNFEILERTFRTFEGRKLSWKSVYCCTTERREKWQPINFSGLIKIITFLVSQNYYICQWPWLARNDLFQRE